MAELLVRYEERTGIRRTEEHQATVDCLLDLWNQGVELSYFTNAASAADTFDLMRSLQASEGYAQYYLYDISN